MAASGRVGGSPRELEFLAGTRLDLGGGFKYFLFSPLFGEDEPILTNIFQLGWFNYQLVIVMPSFYHSMVSLSGDRL